ncbi:hypothetical protein GQ44DRAFT_734072 [Phaeosphaeriaceae sp. PMI808]|nr:hypothetical protein GQ44DRAFT_734072 [Phaeosphaeriaceae sp. PMI808]
MVKNYRGKKIALSFTEHSMDGTQIPPTSYPPVTPQSARVTGGTTADAAFVNQNTGQSKDVTFYSPNENSNARGANAQWVIEQALDTTLADFGEIKFTGSAAAEANEFSYGVAGGTTLDLVRDGTTFATGAINGDSEVDTTYTGP